MRRLLILGSSGSGKSTLARTLGSHLNLPVVHLDKYYWHPGWVGTPQHEWQATVNEFVQEESWIIDGNYRLTLPTRLHSADTVIFLDLPPWVCMWRAIKRRFIYLNQPRPDIARGCREPIFDPRFPAFLRWIWDYPQRARPQVLHQLCQLAPGKQIIWLRRPEDVAHFQQHPQDGRFQLCPTQLATLLNTTAGQPFPK